jgi:hypothetical protein
MTSLARQAFAIPVVRELPVPPVDDADDGIW